ncbi:MAG: type II toxin-antitoxin system VapC family toxin [Pirellulales bacterium]|nr:type II toxin-antitoxin system VapC family toxin [Pirellulales bacterium]
MRLMPSRVVFLDTAYAIAISSPKDEFHEKALVLADQLVKQDARLVTTRAVMVEIGNSLAKQKYRKAAVELLQSLENDPKVEIFPVTEELYQQGFNLYRQREDKEWGLTDCISFVVMKDLGLSEALTPDEDFTQAGFWAILV